MHISNEKEYCTYCRGNVAFKKRVGFPKGISIICVDHEDKKREPFGRITLMLYTIGVGQMGHPT